MENMDLKEMREYKNNKNINRLVMTSYNEANQILKYD